MREKGWRAEGVWATSHVANIGLNRSKHNRHLCRFLRWFFPRHEHRQQHDGRRPQQQTIRCWARTDAVECSQRPDQPSEQPRRGRGRRGARQESRSMDAFLWYMANIGLNCPNRNRGPGHFANWFKLLDRSPAEALPWPYRGPWPTSFLILCTSMSLCYLVPLPVLDT